MSRKKNEKNSDEHVITSESLSQLGSLIRKLIKSQELLSNTVN